VPEPVSACPARITVGSESRVAAPGGVLSIRTCSAAVRTASAFPTLSTEKYLTA
jgi:hypothetical protein